MTSESENISDPSIEGRNQLSEWSVVLPFYNEENFLAATLQSLDAQDCGPFELVLVNNMSTDGSLAIAEEFAATARTVDVTILTETRPGQGPALECGIGAVRQPLVAICDADTIYPVDYLSKAASIFAQGEDVVAVVAFDAPYEEKWKNTLLRIKARLVSLLLARQCHGGGYAQSFRRSVLKETGGYSPAIWPYCLKDHELMNRVSKHGRLGYQFDHVVRPSLRRSNRTAVRWTLFERIMYHVTPFAKKDWFFYSFLKDRFEARGVRDQNLRKRDWDETTV